MLNPPTASGDIRKNGSVWNMRNMDIPTKRAAMFAPAIPLTRISLMETIGVFVPLISHQMKTAISTAEAAKRPSIDRVGPAPLLTLGQWPSRRQSTPPLTRAAPGRSTFLLPPHLVVIMDQPPNQHGEGDHERYDDVERVPPRESRYDVATPKEPYAHSH